jgi:hypothetical protein
MLRPNLPAIARSKRRCVALPNSEANQISKAQKKLRREQEEETKANAFQKLREMIDNNNGIMESNFVRSVAEAYGIDRKALYYRLKCERTTTASRTISTPQRLGNNAAVITPAIEYLTPSATTPPALTGSNHTTNTSNSTSPSMTEAPPAIVSRKQKKIDVANHKALILESTTLAAQRFMDAQKNSTGRLPNGTLKDIVKKTEEEKKLEPGTLNVETIRTRVYRNNVTGFNPQQVSPLQCIDDILVELITRLSRMGKSPTKQDVIELARDIISNTEIAAEYVKRTGKPLSEKELPTVTPSDGWYINFMKRNSDKLKRSAENVMDANRKTYCTLENFTSMYDNIYRHLTEAGIATDLGEEIMMDKNGDQVYSKDLMFGRPSRYKMIRPENMLLMDETGCNTNQKKDGKVGGERYIVPVDGSGVGAIGCTTDLHFSCACFTSGLGTPVMCAIIFASEKDVSEIPMSWKSGIDRTVDLNNGVTLDFNQFIAEAIEPGGALAGGPTCVHNGKTIPCFYGVSPHGGITGKMLAEMLQYLDENEVFERSNDTIPFLLVDGHNSRFSFEFLSYIHGTGHEWKVCIGVPYGTHLWQVADSPQMNGAFKMQLTKAKREYRSNDKGMKEAFSPTDICPLVCSAWSVSYGNVESGRKALAERGWGPLNYALLDHPQLKPSNEVAPQDSPNANNDAPTYTESTINDGGTPMKGIYINLDGPKISQVMNDVIAQVAKEAGRKRAYEKAKVQSQAYENTYDKLKACMRISSGTLTACNHNCLDKNVFRLVSERRELDLAKQNDKEEKRIAREEFVKRQFSISFNCYFDDVNKLKSKDYRVLLTYTRMTGESPTKSKLVDMKQQFQKRNIRSRLLRYDPTLVNETEPEEGHSIGTLMGDGDVNGDIDDVSMSSNGHDEWLSLVAQDKEGLIAINQNMFDNIDIPNGISNENII